MTVRLEELLAAATPGPWVRHEHNQIWVHYDTAEKPPATQVARCIFGDDARLVALAPDAVRLLIDMGEWAKRLYQDDDMPKHWDDCVCSMCNLGRDGRALLARLDRLGNTT